MAALRCYCGISSTVLVARKNSSRTAIIRASMDGGCSRNEESKAGGTNSVRVTAGKQVNKVYRHSFLPIFDTVSIRNILAVL
jgi:hypothetical protein